MFAGLIAALETAHELDPDSLTDGQVADGIVALERARALLDAVSTRLVGALDRRQGHARDGCVSAGSWLAWQGRMSGGAARQRVRVARDLRSMPHAVRAFSAARITFEHARLLVAARTPSTEAAMDRDEALLVSHAERLHTDAFARLIRHWKALADADGSHDDTFARAQRFVHLSSTVDGTWVLHGKLDAESGAIVSTALEHINDELWRSEPSSVRQADVEGTPPRLPSQRRADALVELARRAAVTDPNSSTPARPLISLVVCAGEPGVDSAAAVRQTLGGSPLLVARTDRGAVLGRATAERLACDASIAAIVVNSLGVPIDLGHAVRVPSPAQRRALVARDGGCVFPGCDRPPGWCEAHHVVHHSRGGPTNLDNLSLAKSHLSPKALGPREPKGCRWPRRRRHRRIHRRRRRSTPGSAWIAMATGSASSVR